MAKALSTIDPNLAGAHQAESTAKTSFGGVSVQSTITTTIIAKSEFYGDG